MKPPKANVGSFDGAGRFVAGCVLLILANRGHTWGFAGFALIASTAGFCPLYWLLRIDTTGTDRAPCSPPPNRAIARERPGTLRARSGSPPQNFTVPLRITRRPSTE